MTLVAENEAPSAGPEPSLTAAAQRRERSRAALVSRFPGLAARLEPAPVTPLIRDGDVAIDVDLGANRLYNTDGRALAASQVEQYLAKPLRFFVTDLSGTNLGSEISTRMYRHLMSECGRLGLSVKDLDVKPRYDGCALVILGLGLGYHLPALIEQTKAKTIIIVEPEVELLRLSLETVDWEQLLESNEASGCKFTISIPNDADQALGTITNVFEKIGYQFIDGAYVFTHYPSFVLFKVRDRLVEDVQTLFSSLGYYEDEQIMLTNTLANLAAGRFRLIDPTLRPERPEPVFIIGSGPSIDGNIEQIKRLRSRAVVFSCGTGLRVCLSHGIIPDFHCEIENGEQVHLALSTVRKQFDFTGITLVASMTVDRRVPPLFDNVILFYREAVSGSRIFARREQEIYMAVPTVANTAFRNALAMGFRTFYLFGIDCGTKYSDKRHSDVSVYAHSETLKKAEGFMAALSDTHRGNFGGMVKSDWVMTFSRLMLAEACRIYRPKVYNCSDGCEIEFTTPKVADSVKLPELPRTVKPIKRYLEETLPYLAPKEQSHLDKLQLVLDQLTDYRKDGLEMIDDLIENCRDFIVFWEKFGEFLKKHNEESANVSCLINCSLRSMPKIGMFFIHRIRDDAMRQELLISFFQQYRTLFEVMCDGSRDCIEGLIASYREESALAPPRVEG